MPGIESRRSKKIRETIHINGIQANVLKEISTPNQDGTIPLLNFLENTNMFITDTSYLYERASSLEKEIEIQNMQITFLKDRLKQYINI